MFRLLQTLPKKITSYCQQFWNQFLLFLGKTWDATISQAQAYWETCEQAYEKFNIASKRSLSVAQSKIQQCTHQGIIAINAFFQKIAAIKNWVFLHHTTAADDMKNIGEFIKAYAFKKWAEYQPHIDEFSKWSMAVSATASTLKTSIQILPIIFAISGILAGGIPLVGFLFPEFFFTELALFTLVVGVSLFAGYLKYNELVARAELDAKTEAHEKSLAALTERLDKLEAAHPLLALFQQPANGAPETEEAPKQPTEVAMNDAALSKVSAPSHKSAQSKTPITKQMRRISI